MTDTTDMPLAQGRSGSFVGRFIQGTTAAMEAIPYWPIALIARLAIAGVFWRSGQTKVDGWRIWQPNSDAFTLFQQEYKLPVIDPNIAAYLATWAEHLFPVLIVIGLATPLRRAFTADHDPGDRDFRLSVRLADPRHLGDLFFAAYVAWRGRGFARSSDRAAIPVTCISTTSRCAIRGVYGSR